MNQVEQVHSMKNFLSGDNFLDCSAFVCDSDNNILTVAYF
jgi:hypothetical protein